MRGDKNNPAYNTLLDNKKGTDKDTQKRDNIIPDKMDRDRTDKDRMDKKETDRELFLDRGKDWADN